MSRRTFNVEEIVRLTNESLAKSTCSPDQRTGQIQTIENILHSTGNYRGYRYLMLDEVPDRQLPGIVVHGTVENTPYEIRFAEGTVDQTRIQFFI
jgi:hypothetical protein